MACSAVAADVAAAAAAAATGGEEEEPSSKGIVALLAGACMNWRPPVAAMMVFRLKSTSSATMVM